MSAKVKYSSGPIDKIKVVDDFLPSPEKLVLKDDTVKVTMALSRTSVEFFKREAKKHQTQYQKMIRRLLDAYAQAYEGQPKTSVKQRKKQRA